MKRILLIFISLTFICPAYTLDIDSNNTLSDEDEQNTFEIKSLETASLSDSATAAYKRGEYAYALELYLEIYNRNYVSGPLLYNIAASYYKTGDVARSILFYERALQKAPRDKDIKLSLKIANTHIKDNIEALPVFFLKEWFSDIRNMLSVNQWGILAISSFITVLVFLLIFLTGFVLNRRLAFSLASAALIITFFSLVFAYSSHSENYKGKYAILLNPVVTGKSSPSYSSTDLFIIHEGIKIEILEHLGEWSRIKLPDGNTGWIETKSFESI